MTYPKRENVLKHEIYCSDDLIRAYGRKTNGHFFDKGSMKFFNSRVSDSVYPGNDLIYFITSEKFDYKSPRKYSIRSYNPKTGEIETIGDFQGYNTAATAARNILKILMNEDKKEAV